MLLQANIAQPSARDPVVGMMKRHSRPLSSAWPASMADMAIGRITALLRTEGWHVNAKRVQRIWRREGLKVPQKQPKRGRLWLNDGSCIRLPPCWPNHVWSYDFVMDRTHDGRKFRMLTVIDEFTRRCMAVVVERRLNSGQCTPLSDRALRPTWPAGSYPFRQRLRVYRLSRTRFPWTQNWLNRSVQGGPEHDR